MSRVRVVFLREVLEWRMRAVWKTAVEMQCTAINRGFDSHPLYTKHIRTKIQYFLLILYKTVLPFPALLPIMNTVKKS